MVDVACDAALVAACDGEIAVLLKLVEASADGGFGEAGVGGEVLLGGPSLIAAAVDVVDGEHECEVAGVVGEGAGAYLAADDVEPDETERALIQAAAWWAPQGQNASPWATR